jgi:hypothetical protein
MTQKLLSRITAFALCAFCALLCACPVDNSSPELASVEYLDSTTIKVTVILPDASVSCVVNDDTLSVYSTKHDLYYRITGTVKRSETEYKCFLRKELKPGDRIRATGHGPLSGTVYFDAPGEK